MVIYQSRPQHLRRSPEKQGSHTDHPNPTFPESLRRLNAVCALAGASSELLDLTVDKGAHYGDVHFVQSCPRAHVPAWQPLADAAQLARQSRLDATLQDHVHVPTGVSVHRK